MIPFKLNVQDVAPMPPVHWISNRDAVLNVINKAVTFVGKIVFVVIIIGFDVVTPILLKLFIVKT